MLGKNSKRIMIASMTGFGRGEAKGDGVTITVELRSVNSRFLEVTSRLPRSMSLRENDIKELLRKKISRGKVTLVATIDRENESALALRVNVPAARAYMKLLNQLRTTARLREKVRLEHLLQFSEVIESENAENADEHEWKVFQEALDAAMRQIETMRCDEGGELEADLRSRIALIERSLDTITALSKEQVPQERLRLRERISQILGVEPVDEGRLEMELALLADRLDVTEECVRFRSHNKFFLAALQGTEPAGRKLNFLVQEMNREANTIGSKSSATEIAHLVVSIKEELERIREQIQNIE
jgi:uncharacterized protein (TIGR00255 family)